MTGLHGVPVKQLHAAGRWAATRPTLRRAAVLLSLVSTCLVLVQLCAHWSITHPLDRKTYMLRGSIRLDVHRGCCNAERKWNDMETAKRHMPKDSTYQDMTPEQLRQQLPIRVVSLARETDRRTAITKTLDAAGLTYELVDAVDGSNTSLPDDDVTRFVRGVRLKMWRNHQHYSFQRKKVAVDLSHYHNLERIVMENRTAIIVEDDAEFPQPATDRDAWYKRLLAALQELPLDWDVFYLNVCFGTNGKAISDHVTILRGGLCTLGYVATPKFAHKVMSSVKHANRHLRTPVVDLLYNDLVQHWEVAAYVATPQLADFSSGPSTMNYADGQANLTRWDLFWLW